LISLIFLSSSLQSFSSTILTSSLFLTTLPYPCGFSTIEVRNPTDEDLVFTSLIRFWISLASMAGTSPGTTNVYSDLFSTNISPLTTVETACPVPN